MGTERRSVLGVLLGAGLLAQGSVSLAADDSARKPAGAPVPPAPTLDDARLLPFMKLYASTATELHAVRRAGPTEWLVGSSTLTFFRDHATGACLETFDNPLTGRSIPVKPNRLGTGDKPQRISATGLSASAGQTMPWNLELHSNGGVTWLTTSRYATKAPQPWIEVQSMFAPTAQLDDASRASASSTFVSTYLAPWLGWMNMKEVPGHLVWHAAGRKLASLDELPAAYRKRAEATAPEHFQIR
jgi:hypothetical protein